MTKGRKPKYPQQVCKPCWELKYCPYGPLVEGFPLSPGGRPLAEVEARFEEILEGFAAGRFKTLDEVSEMVESLLYHIPENWAELDGYDTSELECRVYGHVCPVFLTAENVSETVEQRKIQSRHVPRAVLLKVVRRDAQVCQQCGKNVPDDQIHLDHLIPLARGGSTSVENLRVLCATCNRRKSDTMSGLLQQ
jgi:hypothetical protein